MRLEHRQPDLHRTPGGGRLNSRLEAWRGRGLFLAVEGHRVFSVDAGKGGEDRPTVAVLHGFPSCSFDFHRVLGLLSARYRVVLHDQLGFGLSEKPPEASYSLREQAQLALGVWRELGLDKIHLLAHDYGTSVATELLARREEDRLPVEISSLTLCNGSIHMDLARPRLSQYLLKNRLIGPIFAKQLGENFFKRRMSALWADPKRADSRDLEALFEALVSDGGRAVLPRISRYLEERVEYKERWVGALSRVDLPVHVLWARQDPVAVPAIAERLAKETPEARLTWLDDLGHYPMLEDPAAWTEAVLSFLVGL